MIKNRTRFYVYLYVNWINNKKITKNTANTHTVTHLESIHNIYGKKVDEEETVCEGKQENYENQLIDSTAIVLTLWGFKNK